MITTNGATNNAGAANHERKGNVIDFFAGGVAVVKAVQQVAEDDREDGHRDTQHHLRRAGTGERAANVNTLHGTALRVHGGKRACVCGCVCRVESGSVGKAALRRL